MPLMEGGSQTSSIFIILSATPNGRVTNTLSIITCVLCRWTSSRGRYSQFLLLSLISLSRVEGAANRIISFPLVCGGLPLLQRFRFQTRPVSSTDLADGRFVGR